MGKSIPKPKETWRKAAPPLVFGSTLAWGQYVICISVTLLILVSLFQINLLVGALIEIAFEGGHATAVRMQETFASLNFPEEGDLALGLATVGIVGEIIAGTVLANWDREKRYIQTH